jgi:hypothetical protein
MSKNDYWEIRVGRHEYCQPLWRQGTLAMVSGMGVIFCWNLSLEILAWWPLRRLGSTVVHVAETTISRSMSDDMSIQGF